MLKFLRKNQKWMLVIFCGVLMVAFLIPQAVSQFAPNPANTVVATMYDGKEITREQIQRVSQDVEMLRRLRIEPPEFANFGLTLLPQMDSERNNALAWMMIQQAAERNGLGASQNESFNLIASVLNSMDQMQGQTGIGIQDMDSLDARADEFGVSGAYLLEVGRQYLVAEQYRQLVSGIEYNLAKDDGGIGSPGLRRVIAMREAMQAIQQSLQQFQQMAQSNPQMMQQLIAMTVENVLVNQGYLDKIQGHERFSATELRYALQREFAEIDLTVVVLDAENRLEETSVDDAYVQKIFEQFADDAPGTGQPYGIGYREPDKVQLEALRFPIDAVREKVAETIQAEDVARFYKENRSRFIETIEPEEEGGEPTVEIAELTFGLRDQIRQTLAAMRAEEKIREIAQKARLRLNEDARGLPDDGIYKKLPEDFKPMPLTQLASEIESEHGITPEIIVVDEFVSSQDIIEASAFTQSWVSKMPTATIKLPDQRFGSMVDVPIPQTVIGGRAGLFATEVPDFGQRGGRPIRLADYLTAARPFLTPQLQEGATNALQVGLPGATLRDITGSTYVFRITKAQPARPATDMTPIAEQVKKDAKLIKAYEDLVAEEELLLERASLQSIERLMPNAEAKSTLTGLTRSQSTQRFGATIEGVGSTQPILQQAFQITDDLVAKGGFDKATEDDRLFVVELASDYKIAVVRIDTFRPMTRSAFEEQARRPESLMLATTLGANQPLDPPLSFDALQRYTSFKWAEGFGPDEEDEGEDSEESE